MRHGRAGVCTGLCGHSTRGCTRLQALPGVKASGHAHAPGTLLESSVCQSPENSRWVLQKISRGGIKAGKSMTRALGCPQLASVPTGACELSPGKSGMSRNSWRLPVPVEVVEGVALGDLGLAMRSCPLTV